MISDAKCLNLIFVKFINLNRTLTFEAMLKQECGWFDNPKNSVGALTSRLSGDAANLQTVRITFFQLDFQQICTSQIETIVST